MGAKAWAWPERILWLLAVVGLLYLVGLTAWLGLAGLAFPYQLDYGEGFLLQLVRAWSQGQPIYKSIDAYPYVMSNYPPLALGLALALKPLLGLSYAAGRIWTLLAVAASTGLIVAWVRREGGRWLPALAAGLLFAGSPYIYHWAPLFRVDLPGLALTLAGLFVVAWGWSRPATQKAVIASKPPLRAKQSPLSSTSGIASSPKGGAPRNDQAGGSARGLLRRQGQAPRNDGLEEKARRRLAFWLATVLFVAALYTKQSFLFAPAVALVYLFVVDRRAALGMAAAMAGLGGGLFVVLNVVTGGGFWTSLVVSNVNPFLWPEFWKQVADFFGTFAPLALLAAWYLADKFLLDRSTPLRARLSPLDLYLPASLVSLWLAGKAGAWENYFFEALAALSLAAGLGLARLARRPGWLPRLAAPALVLAQVIFMWHTPSVAQDYLALTRRSNEAMAPILAATPDPIVSEDMGLLVTNDKVMNYCSFQYSQLARAGRWDQHWELGQLRQRAFSLVILEQDTRLDVDRYQRFTRAFLSELDRNYRHSRNVGKYAIYEPAPLQHERPAAFGQGLALVGWSLYPPQDMGDWQALAPGDTVRLDVVWQAQQALETGYTAFAHLVDGQGQGWAGDDHQPYDGLYPTSAWGAGEMVRDAFTLTVPADAPPGLYDVQVGWYDPATQDRLPVGDGSSLRLAVLPVDWTGTDAGSLVPLDVEFGAVAGNGIRLEGYRWQAGPGATELEITLRWRAMEHPQGDYQVFLHLLSGDEIVGQGDGPPLDGRWPTLFWLPGLALDDVHRVSLPADLPAGRYDLLVGLYDPNTGVRLPASTGGDAVRLEGIDIGPDG
ncbi:MAG: hypothetical protein P8129_07430 [Anaerolineae bacterium]